MPVNKITIDDVLKLRDTMPVLDVRSPGEYDKAHIPGAFSFPIFSNEERHIIGTAYKQESREKAIRLGLDFFGLKMSKMVLEAEQIVNSKKLPKEVIVHCWRGGMRSAAIGWLLDLYGFKVHLISGGYKKYRHWVLEQFDKSYELAIVGGCTGANKTGMLHTLRKQGEPVIDLEALAAHKGSAFGNLRFAPQPSQEHFENCLALELFHLSTKQKPVWVESESQRIGLINIPFSFYTNMRQAPLYYMDVPFEERLLHILKDYGAHEKEKLINAIIRITKKLGGLETKNAVNALLEDDVAGCFRILLKYYDKLYRKSTEGREKETIIYVDCDSTDAAVNTGKLLQHARAKH